VVPGRGGGRGRPGGGRHEFIGAELLHDEASNAHAHASAENGQKSGQAGNQHELERFNIAREHVSRRDVSGAHEERKNAHQREQHKKDAGRSGHRDKRAAVTGSRRG